MFYLFTYFFSFISQTACFSLFVFFLPSYILFICAVKISNWNFSICFHEVTKENFSNDAKMAKELASFHTKTRNRQAELIVSRAQVRENERNMEVNERDREKATNFPFCCIHQNRNCCQKYGTHQIKYKKKPR